MFEQFVNPESISSIIALVLAIGFGSLWIKGKTKLTDFRNLVVAVDDAVVDNSVSEEEFNKIWEAAKKVFSL